MQSDVEVLSDDKDLLEELEVLCKRHDWNFWDSDDHYMYMKGLIKQQEIDKLYQQCRERNLGKEAILIMVNYCN